MAAVGRGHGGSNGVAPRCPQTGREGPPGPRSGRGRGVPSGPVRDRHGDGSMGTLATCRGFPCGAWAGGGRHGRLGQIREKFFRRTPPDPGEGRRRKGCRVYTHPFFLLLSFQKKSVPSVPSHLTPCRGTSFPARCHRAGPSRAVPSRHHCNGPPMYSSNSWRATSSDGSTSPRGLSPEGSRRWS